MSEIKLKFILEVIFVDAVIADRVPKIELYNLSSVIFIISSISYELRGP
jgi:hypothetical protein